VKGWAIRTATLEDVAVLEDLVRRSARRLLPAHYSPAQIEAALGPVFGVDVQLVRDGTTLVVQDATGRILACGSWSRRRSLFGSDAHHSEAAEPLDPAVDAARIRAFFVDPGHARRGLGKALLEACEAAIREAGFGEVELVATLAGQPLYSAHGYAESGRFGIEVPGVPPLEAVRMRKALRS
jgi:GNAT superfamily N-acetyltransferase